MNLFTNKPFPKNVPEIGNRFDTKKPIKKNFSPQCKSKKCENFKYFIHTV